MTAPLTRRRAPRLIVFALIGVTAALAVWWLRPGEQAMAPTLELAYLDGSRSGLASLRGRPVLVNFWSLTCAPCLEELPDLARFHAHWRPRGLEMIAIAMPYDPPLQVRNFARERSLPWRVALDVGGEAARAFAVSYVPMTFILDPAGRIVHQQAGKLDTERAGLIISPLLPPAE